ncbi:MAG TPA: hypothetical protein VF768_01695 [Holophagaceae bacterium]
MPLTRPRPFGWDLLIRAIRFFYLLWGGMLLSTLAFYGRLRVPASCWRWPGFCRLATGPWGRALALGLGFVMCLAALAEVWEWVDRLLVRIMGDQER